MRSTKRAAASLLAGLIALVVAGCNGGGRGSAARDDCYAGCEQAAAECSDSFIPVEECRLSCDDTILNESAPCLEPLAIVYACQAEVGFTCTTAGPEPNGCGFEIQQLIQCRLGVGEEEQEPPYS